jgi:hypothetical protein
MDLNLNGLTNVAIHVLGLGSDDRGIVELNVVSQVDTVISDRQLVRMLKTDVALMLLQPCVHGMACLPNVDLATHRGDSVYARCPSSQVIFDQPEETKYFPGRQAH